MNNKYEEIEQIVTGIKEDFSKFYGAGNKAAGTRIRKAMQVLKTVAQEIRKDVQDTKNNS